MPRLAFTARGSWVRIAFVAVCCLVLSRGARAQDQPPPAYLAVVEGVATIERNGESEPAVRDMPFLEGDRLRTENGRVEIQFPDGTAIEVAEDSLVEAVTPTRVRLLAGTMDHIQRAAPEEAPQAMSASYLPQDLQPYGGTFDRYGSWQYAAPYGYVWYPTVASGWRPYYYGRWYAAPSYGWTWLGIDAWSYPTHHYGRWGYARNAWFWIPGRTWGAAWVSWGAAPDYVSWCPLGYDNRPVFALSVSSYDSWRRGGGNWFGWTVMSRSHFGGRGSYAQRYAVEPRSLPSETPFIFSSRAPVALPHQSAVGGRQLATGDRPSSAAGRRQSSADSRGYAVPRRPSPAEASAVLAQPGVGETRMRSPRADYGAPPFDRAQGRPIDTAQGGRRSRPAPEQPAPDNSRQPGTSFGVPRRAYPIEAPRSVPAPAAAFVAPTYRSPGRPFDGVESRRRWNPTLGAEPRGGAPSPAAPSPAPAPRNFGAPIQPPSSPAAVPRSFGAPVQRGPAAAPAPAPAAPPRSEGARPAPAGAARDGGAQPRGQGESRGAPGGARRPR
jgi:hypothetical protein